MDEVAASISDATASGDESLLNETVNELSSYERKAVWGRLNDSEQQFLKQARSAA